MEKIKLFIQSEKGKDILIIIIVVLVGLASFELGRLSNEDAGSGVKILTAQAGTYQEANVLASVNPPAKVSTSTNSGSKTFFASSRGTKYYSIGCSAGKTIKQENRVYFSTAEEAQNAGYVLSASCK